MSKIEALENDRANIFQHLIIILLEEGKEVETLKNYNKCISNLLVDQKKGILDCLFEYALHLRKLGYAYSTCFNYIYPLFFIVGCIPQILQLIKGKLIE